jgi:site-specific recombinase XerD
MSGDVFKQFHAHLEARDKSLHSIRAYLSDLRQFATWFTEHTGETFAMETITEYDVRDWRDHLAATMKPATINRRDAALLEFLAATGLRASEVANLTVGDVELNERSGWAIVRGKGRKQRRVPVHARARRALNEYLEERDDPAGDEPLFLSQKGGAISSYAVWYTVKKYAALAEVEDVTPHTFRHTVATQLVRDPEVDLVTAATFLGHSRLDTTAQYSQPNKEDLAKAAKKLE